MLHVYCNINKVIRNCKTYLKCLFFVHFLEKRDYVKWMCTTFSFSTTQHNLTKHDLLKVAGRFELFSGILKIFSTIKNNDLFMYTMFLQRRSVSFHTIYCK